MCIIDLATVAVYNQSRKSLEQPLNDAVYLTIDTFRSNLTASSHFLSYNNVKVKRLVIGCYLRAIRHF